MKTRLNLFVIFLISHSLYAQAQQVSGRQPYQVKSFANAAISNAEVETSGGSISVEGAAAAQTRVEVYVNGNEGRNQLSNEELNERLKQYELTVTVTNGRLLARAKPKSSNMNWKKALSISFKVFVNKTVNTKLATSGGSISLVNLSGDQDFTTSGGSISVKGVAGNISGRTSGGSITVSDSEDQIDLVTSGGSISASNCKGAVKLTTSGGSLDLSNLNGEIEAITSGGAIQGHHIRGELSAKTSGGSIGLSHLSCSLETGTSAGSVNLQFDELGKYIKANVSAGNITLQLPKNKGLNLNLSAGKIKTSALSNFSGSTVDNRIEGKLNGGGIPVDVDAGSGSIRLDWN